MAFWQLIELSRGELGKLRKGEFKKKGEGGIFKKYKKQTHKQKQGLSPADKILSDQSGNRPEASYISSSDETV